MTFDPVQICRVLNEEGVAEVVIVSKRAVNRLKDQRDLPYLESLRDEIG